MLLTKRFIGKALLAGLSMDVLSLIFVCIVIFYSIYSSYRKFITNKRSSFIRNYEFPNAIKTKVAQAYPHLKDRQLEQVIKGLRDYFDLVSLSHRKSISMPSQAVDVAWHEFILFTRQYDAFCKKSLGYFLHHTPAEAMKSKLHAQAGIKRAWRIACHRENINPLSPKRLPIIFALDSKLNIRDGFHYQLDCMSPASSKISRGVTGENYCGTHIGCSSGCAGSSGDGGCAGDSGGGGCGGD